jgi:F-type H+-transporting ATPase subunit b
MLIDWFTVVAQVINFLILVWLLKRFLYRPILDAIDAREQHIALALADADAKEVEAKKERDEFQRKNQLFEQQRVGLLRQATDAATAERQRLLSEARHVADALAAKRQEALRNEADNLRQSITQRTRQEVFAIARKTLADLASASLEERMAELFIRRLRALDGPAKATVAAALKTASDPALLRSAFELPNEQRLAIQNALDETFSTKTRLRFETAPDLISGIELVSNGNKIAWSIADYLTSLARRLRAWRVLSSARLPTSARSGRHTRHNSWCARWAQSPASQQASPKYRACPVSALKKCCASPATCTASPSMSTKTRSASYCWAITGN